MADDYLNAILVRQGYGRWCRSEAASDKRISDAQETLSFISRVFGIQLCGS